MQKSEESFRQKQKPRGARGSLGLGFAMCHPENWEAVMGNLSEETCGCLGRGGNVLGKKVILSASLQKTS